MTSGFEEAATRDRVLDILRSRAETGFKECCLAAEAAMDAADLQLAEKHLDGMALHKRRLEMLALCAGGPAEEDGDAAYF